MKNRIYAITACTSASLVALEVVWTRIFSAQFFYTFAFLILSLAVLLLGLGGLAIRFHPSLRRREALGRVLVVSAFTALAGPALVVHIAPDFSRLLLDPGAFARFVAIFAILGVPFFTGGIAMANLFRGNHEDMPRLYMADLLGAGGGILAAVAFMNTVQTPRATVLSALPLVVAAILASVRRTRLWAYGALGFMAVLAVAAETIYYPASPEDPYIVERHWDAMAKVTVLEADPSFRLISIDNIANSPAYKSPGVFPVTAATRVPFAVNVDNLIARFASCRFLSLGAGGGADVLMALQDNCAEVHAVEVNPTINGMVTDGVLAHYTGNIYTDPRVTVVTEDGRAYVRRFTDAFDIIFSLAPTSNAALASGSFALAENYLFTIEAFEDYYRALSGDGYLVMGHDLYMPRAVGQALEALRRLGVDAPRSHLAVYEFPSRRLTYMIMGRKPLAQDVLDTAFGPVNAATARDIRRLYPRSAGVGGSLYESIIVDGWESVADTAPTDISPTDDNRPFVAQIGLWRNFSLDNLDKVNQIEPFSGFPLSKIVLATVIAIILAAVVPLTLLPFLFPGEKLRPASWLYFFFIGMGYMIVEVVLIQKYTLFMGSSTYTFIVILFSLLVASGIGSRFALRLPAMVPFVAIVVWLVLEVTVFYRVSYTLGGLPWAARALLTVLLVAPLGFFMGMPFPRGTVRVGTLVDWGFAVNGTASVLGSTGVMVIAMKWGFTAALATGAICYLAALAAYRADTSW